MNAATPMIVFAKKIIKVVNIFQAVSVQVRARTHTRAGAAHSVRSACADLVPPVRAMCV